MAENREHWHLSKSVPVSIIIVLVLQFAGFVGTFATLKSDVTRAQADIERLDRQVDIMRTSSQEQAQRLARIEERLLGVQGSLDRLVRAIEQQAR
jgi:molecular chaperone GrpE (heat shock protein)